MMMRWPGIFALLLPLILGGCWIEEPKKTLLVGTGMDMFGPVELRVHPLTRVTADSAPDGKRMLEIRLELADQFGDVTKGVGKLTFTLARAGALTSAVVDRWENSLETPQENKDHWDAITRTYLFRRELPAGLESESLQITATLTTPGGHALSDETKLK